MLRRFTLPAMALVGGLLALPVGADDKGGGNVLPGVSGASDELKKSLQPVAGDPTACHMCEWRPHPFVMPAAQQCGMGADGSPNLGVFSCGLEKNCDKRCDFVQCGEN